MLDKHLDRWGVARAAFKGQAGREVVAFALVMIDSSGEVYCGAEFPADPARVREMAQGLDQIRADLKRYGDRAGANVEVQGPHAALSRAVPCNDGLAGTATRETENANDDAC